MVAVTEFMTGYSARLASSIPVENQSKEFEKGWLTANLYLHNTTQPTYLEMTTEMLFGNPKFKVLESDFKLKNFNVSWGENAHLLTAEERAKVLFKALTNVGDPVEDIDGQKDSVNVEAYAKGVDAYHSKTHNPYLDGSDDAKSWEVGYGDAHNRAMEALPACGECGSRSIRCGCD